MKYRLAFENRAPAEHSCGRVMAANISYRYAIKPNKLSLAISMRDIPVPRVPLEMQSSDKRKP